jgi:hypothetical protein
MAPAFGQDDKPTFPLDHFYVERHKPALRALLKNFRFSASLGYGNTFFNHNLNQFIISQQTGKPPEIYSDKNPTVRYSNWVNTVIADSLPTVSPVYKIKGDTTRIGFKGGALNIPLKLTIHYEFMERYRIGVGYSYEWMSLGKFYPTTHTDKISGFQPAGSSGFMKKYFGMLGVSFYRLDKYLFTGDVNIGGFNPGSNFNLGQIKKGIYYNLGVTAERELSEYLKVFARPSYDFKSYSISIPGTGESIKHSMNAFYLNVGVTYTIPLLPKCFKSDCKIQINHAHGNKEYRSRVHPIYKKQNPGYGENHPTLIKYKGKNKKKLNPY